MTTWLVSFENALAPELSGARVEALSPLIAAQAVAARERWAWSHPGRRFAVRDLETGVEHLVVVTQTTIVHARYA